MPTDPMTKLSKRMSYVLRHNPASIGLQLDTAAWTTIDALVAAFATSGISVTPADIHKVIETSTKRRFELDGPRVRAAQGHSVDVDLDLPAAQPPPILYHGTATATVGRILHEGLRPMSRQHVHLSADRDTARVVGARHGTPTVLLIDAAAMHLDGHTFRCAANGVWLTELVPPVYLREYEPTS